MSDFDDSQTVFTKNGRPLIDDKDYIYLTRAFGKRGWAYVSSAELDSEEIFHLDAYRKNYPTYKKSKFRRVDRFMNFELLIFASLLAIACCFAKVVEIQFGFVVNSLIDLVMIVVMTIVMICFTRYVIFTSSYERVFRSLREKNLRFYRECDVMPISPKYNLSYLD